MPKNTLNFVNIMLIVPLKWKTQNGRIVPLAWETRLFKKFMYYVVRQKE